MEIIKVTNLTKVYKVPIKQGTLKSIFWPKFRQVRAVDKINFTIKEGESVAFLGPNGAGKTTTLKMLTGLLYPTSGTVEVLGFAPVGRKREFLKQIALVMGNKNSLSWDLTPMQNFVLFKSMYGLPDSVFKKRLNELVTLLDISEILDIPVRKHSLGQRLKAELIGSLMHMPRVLFLDEPTLGLDIIAKRKIREFLRFVNKEHKTTIILTSHEMADIEKVSDRVIVINEGIIAFDDKRAMLNKKYKNKKFVEIRLKKNVEREEIAKFGEIVTEDVLSYTIEIPLKKQGEIIAAILDTLPVEDIDLKGVPMEEMIEDLFSKDR